MLDNLVESNSSPFYESINRRNLAKIYIINELILRISIDNTDNLFSGKLYIC